MRAQRRLIEHLDSRAWVGNVIVAVPPDKIWKIWPQVANMIDDAYASADELMPGDILDQLRSARMVLWVACDVEGNIITAATTILFAQRSGRVCKIVCCGGQRPQEWHEAVMRLEDYAKAEQCVKVVLEGREGWLRALDGYRKARVVLERVL